MEAVIVADIISSTSFSAEQLVMLQEELKKFINDNKDIDIILCTISFREVLRIKEDILNSDNVCFDTSGFKDKLFAMPEIRKEGLIRKARFGSMAPIFCFESSYLIYNEED